MIGTTLGNRYTILSELGSGGMATVYKAHCAYLQRDVAIKVLKEDLCADDELLHRFDVEARSAASLTHPNIVQIYDVGREENLVYIVMELVDGKSLKELITENGPMPWQIAVDVMMKICSALQKAHTKGIIHRDIKPQNIMMTQDGEPKVADFGIAKTASSGMDTMKVDTVASVHYASPEQVRGGYTDAQSDLYSVGITLYEMLTGKLPYDGENPVSVALRHIQDAVPRVDFEREDIPKSLGDIVEKCMQKNRADRYETATLLYEDLEAVRKNPEIAVITIPMVKKVNETVLEGLVPVEEGNMAHYTNKRFRNRRRLNARKMIFPLLYIVLIGIIIALIVNIVQFVTKDLSATLPTASAVTDVVIGDYVGRPFTEVSGEIDLAGIKPVEVTYRYDDAVAEGVVIEQHPLDGSKLIIGGLTTLQIVVSKGKNSVTIPEILQMDRTELRLKLVDELGLNVEEKSEYSTEYDADQVIRLDPAPGLEVVRGSTVTLYWSLGKEQKQVAVPDLTGLDRTAAEAKLKEFKLVVGALLPTDVDITGRVVSAQSVTPGDLVPEGTTVDITFKAPAPTPPPTPIPDPTASVTPPPPTDSGPTVSKVTFTVKLPAHITEDTAQLTVVTRNNLTEVTDLVFDSTLKRTDFPYQMVVNIPDGGGISVLYYINGDLEYQQDY